MFFLDTGPSGFRDIYELPGAAVTTQDGPVFVMHVETEPVHLRKGMTVHQQQSFVPVVVEIQKSASPANEACVERHAGRNSHIVEFGIAAIAIERLAFVRKIGAEDVWPT